MLDFYLSINKNTLKVSFIDKEGFKSSSLEVSSDYLNDSRIVDIKGVSDNILQMFSSLGFTKVKNLSMNVVVQPKDVIFSYITVNKGNGDIDEQVISEVKRKGEVNLDELYFSYKKIAPFLYQFIGINKEIIDSYINISNEMGITLKSVVPWIMILPKFVNTVDPAVFVSKVDGEQVIALSELGGIFYASSFENERSIEDMSKLMKELSLYKKSNPIKKVFSLNYENYAIPGFETIKIGIPDVGSDSLGFETNVLTNYYLDTNQNARNNQLNLLNLLPLPVVKEPSKVPMIVGGSVAIMLLISLLVGGGIYLKSRDSSVNNQMASNNQDNVLSDQSKAGDVSNQNDQESKVEEVKVELKRSDLELRIENGSGVDGQAGRTKEFLEGLGYNVESIDTADSQIEKTTLQFKKDKVNFSDLIKEDMKKYFPSMDVKDDLADDSEYDLLIITGTSSTL